MAKREPKPWTFEKHLRSTRKQLNERYSTVIEWGWSNLATHAELKSLTDWVSTSIGCAQLANWRGAKGIVDLATDPIEGWRIINESCHWHLLSQQIYDAYRARPVRPRANRTRTALLLAHGLAVDDESITRWAGDLLLGSVTHPDWIVDAWNLNELPWFMARLYARLVGSSDTDGVVGMCKASVYDEIVAAWDEPDRLAALLPAACDFHIRNPGPYENFVAYPFDCYPAELLAIFRVRQRLGLETPPVSHPLLESPLARPPIPLPEFSEPAMQRSRDLMPTIDIHSEYKPDP